MMEEELNPATMSSLLKERIKENKMLIKRNQKLEERYVAKHRELSDVLSDRSVFMNFLAIMFPDQELNYASGTVTLDRLELLNQGKEEEYRRVLQQTNLRFNDEASKLKTKVAALQADLKAKELELKELNALHTEVNRLQALNVEMRAELEFTDKQLEEFKVENAKIKSQQNEFAKYRANSLLAAFDSKAESGDDTTGQLQTQLAESRLKIQELKARIKGYEENGRHSSREPDLSQNVLLEVTAQRQMYEERLSEMEKQLSSAQHEFQEHRRRAQKLMMEKDIQIEKLKAKLQQANLDSEDSFSRSRIIEAVDHSLSDVNMEYLKNIILKYMEYSSAGYIREAQTLAGVIYTVMDFSPEEIELIRKAREEKGVIQSVTGLFAVKSPGSGVSYNTLHTNEGRRRANLPPLGESSRIENS